MITEDVEPRDPLLLALGDGRWHSGPQLAAHLGITRSAVSARLARLRETGLEVYAVSGKGYRLTAPIDWLSAPAIRGELSTAATGLLDRLALCQRVDSTNTRVAACRDGSTRACLAEQQTAGRGRAGRPWVSPFAANLYLSVGHDLAAPRAPVAALSLAVGVALAHWLAGLGVAGIGLKWPNDLWIGERKVGGILTEARSEAGGCARLVVGVGLNVAMPRAAGRTIDQPWTRLADHLPTPMARSALAGGALDAVLGALAGFERDGFEPYAARWADYDRLAGRTVSVGGDAQPIVGRALGIAPDGGLRVAIDGRCRTVYAGDVRVRPTGSDPA